MGQFRLLAWTGLSVIAASALVHNAPRLSPGMFDWAEPGNVAAALAQGRGFSDPFDGGTGATAWVSPVPAWIEAGVFLLFGVKTVASAKALLLLVVVGLAGANALIVAALEPYGKGMCRAASAAFLAYTCLLPGGPLTVLSEAWLDMLLSAALLWAVIGCSRSAGAKAAATLAGVALLAPLENAGVAVAAGFCVLVLGCRAVRSRRSLAVPLTAAVAAFAATASWSMRNEAALGRLIPLKSNSWFELHLANVDSADGLPRMETVLRRLPFFDAGEFRRYSELGEMRYVDSFKAPALAALKADPAHFAGNVLRRLEAAIAFCRREGGGEATSFHFRPEDSARLASSGQIILTGPSSALWTRIDAPPSQVRDSFARMGLVERDAIFADWSARRLAYDREFRGPAGLLLGLLTAGVPVAALLLSALFSGGHFSVPAGWAALIALGMLLPYVLVNHNDRHQESIIALQAVAIGALAQAISSRRGRAGAGA
ncbi:MAG TPA: hypothetical protein VFE25_11635 [Opitutaceae bacterium]|jgi:hypothetical protein|nr:hypothetical protein [Opitutaceae bacterium]